MCARSTGDGSTPTLVEDSGNDRVPLQKVRMHNIAKVSNGNDGIKRKKKWIKQMFIKVKFKLRLKERLSQSFYFDNSVQSIMSLIAI